MGKLDGKVALISGGARGQGAAEAETFAREGAKVVFGDVRDVEGQKVEVAIRAAGYDATYMHLDVTSEADWQEAVKLAEDRHGRLDILINNAAIVIPRVPIDERTVAEWDQVMAVNARGVFLGTKHAIPAMRRAGGGSIVNISSVAGIGRSLHQEPAYAASKGAVRIFTKVTASQHAKDKIRCNSVHPGPVDTEMFHSACRSAAWGRCRRSSPPCSTSPPTRHRTSRGASSWWTAAPSLSSHDARTDPGRRTPRASASGARALLRGRLPRRARLRGRGLAGAPPCRADGQDRGIARPHRLR